MAKQLIIISGAGGAGKETTAKGLLENLESCAWIDMKNLIKVNPWEYNKDLKILGVKNAASLIKNFLKVNYNYIILSGGLASQELVNELEIHLNDSNVQIKYIWLNADKKVRDERRIKRARDEGDKAEFLDHIDNVFFDPGEITLRQGSYHRVNTSNKNVNEVIASVKQIIL